MTGLTEHEQHLLCEIFRRDSRIEEVILFGSRAKGSHSASSDIDLAVRGSLDALQAQGLAGVLDELPLPYQYDVVALQEIKSSDLLDHIERVGISLYRA